MLSRILGALAGFAGTSVRLGRTYGHGIAGAAAVSIGVGLYDYRIGLIVGGAFLLLLDGKR